MLELVAEMLKLVGCLAFIRIFADDYQPFKYEKTPDIIVTYHFSLC